MQQPPPSDIADMPVSLRLDSQNIPPKYKSKMCYVGKATKIFIFIVTALVVLGLVLGFGLLRHHKSHSHKCSGGDSCPSPNFFPNPISTPNSPPFSSSSSSYNPPPPAIGSNQPTSPNSPPTSIPTANPPPPAVQDPTPTPPPPDANPNPPPQSTPPPPPAVLPVPPYNQPTPVLVAPGPVHA
ncbi:hypothetical protein ES319_D04G170100v1 [Gossypium barbadense]|uniref:Pollen-specific leucine-rich repeat extensin-like protein 3 n=5 Tax=Gossypium TaxID=3633 RepID=A0ABM2ZVW1_GOSHI|nr:pollen-specific leucine-rich repeat extensin-like protein 3 [Gossypium hirsutum]XP_040946786.1 pollen-specific leucine-rich repeat extensin-like protein 3 [Gossypium hirsutum]KAB2035682.1 hypothetical protein ES319_D04G170100v1 [Gossypium barbadense]TYG74398.1 hypothetical protein ES288_D04G179900v1 [Gossypium darwinii]KAB2035683.1 hypothetical protein ES319_D04G170100v1 [Gossypium barbadense]KAB2035684.1 hypothetical protein ES319_D04G170100v1 [Gossypium barbadense]